MQFTGLSGFAYARKTVAEAVRRLDEGVSLSLVRVA